MEGSRHGLPATRTLRVYVLTVAIAAAATTVPIWLHWGPPQLAAALFFWAMHVAAESTAIGLPMGSLSAGFLILMTAAFATSPTTAAIVGALSAVSLVDWRRRDVRRALFNASQGALYVAGASSVFWTLRSAFGDAPATLLAASVLAAGVAFVCNTGLVAGAVSLERRRTLMTYWRELLWPAPAYLAFAVVALLVGSLYRGAGPVAAVLLVTPLVVVRLIHLAYVDLDRAHERTLRAFIRVLELKDEHTRGHSERVAEIAGAIFSEMGKRGSEMRTLYRGALLHDIGKVAVSGRILAKPGPLTAEEFSEIRTHPVVGAEVALGISFLDEEVEQILFHHERLDGAGYPAGLVGEDIPFSARVLAVADAFESMLWKRPYRAPVSATAALAEIERSTGTQFDPVPAGVLARLVREGRVAVPAFTAGSIRQSGPAIAGVETAIAPRHSA